MAETRRRRTVDASPLTVWDVLADFGTLDSWVDGVDHSAILRHGTNGLVGTSRRVQLKRDALVETVTEADAPRSLAYDIVGMPHRLGRLSNRWTLRPCEGGGTEVTLTSTVHARRSLHGRIVALAVARVMGRKSDGMLAGLARRSEPHHG